ncbi:hypothetical protein GCM10023320_57090 [Pseudonocardia adelaidensis]|uniref:Uncharacterized protein n=1 Tax=Pseudonocardia adelaidensis TaxID=648754 RepID=A0ABP9NRD1_9PSEU
MDDGVRGGATGREQGTEHTGEQVTGSHNPQDGWLRNVANTDPALLHARYPQVGARLLCVLTIRPMAACSGRAARARCPCTAGVPLGPVVPVRARRQDVDAPGAAVVCGSW